MTDNKKICPLCGSTFELKQINFTSAVLMCVDIKCPYSECIEVERNSKDSRRKSRKCNTNRLKKETENEMPLNNPGTIKNLVSKNAVQTTVFNGSSSKDSAYQENLNVAEILDQMISKMTTETKEREMDTSDLDFLLDLDI